MWRALKAILEYGIFALALTQTVWHVAGPMLCVFCSGLGNNKTASRKKCHLNPACCHCWMPYQSTSHLHQLHHTQSSCGSIQPHPNQIDMCDAQGWATTELHPGRTPPEPSMAPLLDAILEHVPAPPGEPSGQFAMLVTMTERDSFLGRVATGRIASGHIKVGDKIRTLRHSGEPRVVCVKIS